MILIIRFEWKEFHCSKLVSLFELDVAIRFRSPNHLSLDLTEAEKCLFNIFRILKERGKKELTIYWHRPGWENPCLMEIHTLKEEYFLFPSRCHLKLKWYLKFFTKNKQEFSSTPCQFIRFNLKIFWSS